MNAVRSTIGDFTYDVGEQADEFRERARQALNRQVSSTLTVRTDLTSPEIRGPFTDDSNFVFTASLSGRSEVDVTPRGAPMATGNEIRFVSVAFDTSGDDKDAEEPVDIYLNRGSQVLAQRKVGALERWGDSPPEDPGPYFLTVPLTEAITDCHQLTLRIYKEPAGSRTGKGWKNVMHARLFLADGSDRPAAHSNFSQWGDGDDQSWDHNFGLCDTSQ